MRRDGIALTLVAVLVAGLPASAAPDQPQVPDDPPVADTAGDANYLNDQGLRLLGVPPVDQGPDTRPANLDGADLTAAWYETTYDTVVDRDADGMPLRARHVPTGLRVHLATTGPAAPTLGPTVSYALWVRVGSCSMIFRMYVAGPASRPDDPPQRAELRTRGGDCIEGPKTYTDGISLEFDGTVATLDYPFEAVTYNKELRVFGPGRTILPDADGHGFQNASVHGNVGGPVIDFAAPTRPFVIGSDVPADVDCVADAGHAACGG